MPTAVPRARCGVDESSIVDGVHRKMCCSDSLGRNVSFREEKSLQSKLKSAAQPTGYPHPTKARAPGSLAPASALTATRISRSPSVLSERTETSNVPAPLSRTAGGGFHKNVSKAQRPAVSRVTSGVHTIREGSYGFRRGI